MCEAPGPWGVREPAHIFARGARRPAGAAEPPLREGQDPQAERRGRAEIAQWSSAPCTDRCVVPDRFAMTRTASAGQVPVSMCLPGGPLRALGAVKVFAHHSRARIRWVSLGGAVATDAFLGPGLAEYGWKPHRFVVARQKNMS